MAQLNYPHALALTADGGFLIVDSNNNRIRKVSPSGIITTVAGNGTPGYMGDSGPATLAELRRPEGVATTPDGGFLVADTSNHAIRRVSPGGTITTVVGNGTPAYGGDTGPATGAFVDLPEGIAPTVDGGYIISDDQNNRVRKVSPAGTITTIVGNGTPGYMGDGSPAAGAELKIPEFVSITPTGGLLIADHDNFVIRAVQAPFAGVVTPPTATTSPASPANDNHPNVKGTAPAGSRVALFSTPDCSGPSVVSGSAASFGSPGLPIAVADNSTTKLHAVVYAAGGQLSACSSSTITYVEDSIPPIATIGKHPKHTVTTHKKKAKVRFSFRSNEPGSSFRCKLDKGNYHSCGSPKSYTLKPGKHNFRVLAVDKAGNVGVATKSRFKIVHQP
jgi:hypothetical protein